MRTNSSMPLGRSPQTSSAMNRAVTAPRQVHILRDRFIAMAQAYSTSFRAQVSLKGIAHDGDEVFARPQVDVAEILGAARGVEGG